MPPATLLVLTLPAWPMRRGQRRRRGTHLGAAATAATQAVTCVPLAVWVLPPAALAAAAAAAFQTACISSSAVSLPVSLPVPVPVSVPVLLPVSVPVPLPVPLPAWRICTPRSPPSTAAVPVLTPIAAHPVSVTAMAATRRPHAAPPRIICS
eukprot:CAMPEP_0202400136 /NCGR_PEP_ID=MMETSP1128-20130828/2497_1 /ASSEMBLY_ACC=CAM_ASM_000463 /TAXON_ID=3047 /ORGANISM="Dunaliella tertiolecta, Strain CCMP1320" /LENGTH=151 /DNA_ID=CAMNT_0049003601 /DNA_START=2021 /DNA_END=2476 /DNA_ORIENTATION=-